MHADAPVSDPHEVLAAVVPPNPICPADAVGAALVSVSVGLTVRANVPASAGRVS